MAASRPSGDSGSESAKKIGIHLEGPLRRKLAARAEAAQLTEGQMAKQLLKECLEGTAVVSSQDALAKLQAEVADLKLLVDSLRGEVATTFAEDQTSETLRPLLQELRNDIATAIRAALGLAGFPGDEVGKVISTAFPGGVSKADETTPT